MNIPLVWHLSFREIAFLRDSTTVALFLKNNVFIVRFSLNRVSFVCEKFHSTIFGIYGVFCTKITHSIRARCLFHFIVFNDHFRQTFVLYEIFVLEKSRCLGTQPPWHFFLKITSSSFASFPIAFLLFANNFIQLYLAF